MANKKTNVLDNIDNDDIPILSEERIMNSQNALERRRNKGAHNKDTISLRIDHDLLEWLKSAGPGYQTRLNKILREIMDFSKRGNVA